MSIKLKFRESSVVGKDGVLYFQIIHGRKIRRLNTVYHIMQSEWDTRRECVIIPAPQSPRYSKLCSIMYDIEWEMKRFSMREDSAGEMLIDELIAVFQGEGDDGKGLFDFMQSQIHRLRSLNRDLSSETMMQTLQSFTKFRGGVDISVARITRDIVEQY